jgi:acetyl-CoA C-acetyltransferase
MGQTAEVLAHLFNISRCDADAYAVESHLRLSRAQARGGLPVKSKPHSQRDGKFYEHDDGVRPDSSVENRNPELCVRAPVGKVTAGNSSQITDGASWSIVASEDAVK